MNPPDFGNAIWRQSTWSGGNGGQCVEVAVLDGGLVGLRDSKDDGGPVLVFSPGVWGAFLAGTRGRPWQRV